MARLRILRWSGLRAAASRLQTGGIAGCALLLAASAAAQGPVERAEILEDYPIPAAVVTGFDFRMVGPSRGGRVTTVTGIRGRPHEFWMGSTGGGVWKTENAGVSWTNVSDDDFAVGSIGAVAVAPSDPEVVWVGTGSACPRGNVSVGNGVYRSTDGGRNWTHVGLPEAGLIGRIVVDPLDPDRAFVAVLGQIFGRSEERGVYRTEDGGASWEAVLQVSDLAGAVDLAMDPSNPRRLFAAIWEAERKPWTLVDGGAESGLFRSEDGGETWRRVEGGLPSASEEAPVGRIGVSIAASRPSRIYALVTAGEERGGLYRSEDGGENWRRINGDRRLRGRGWYYAHVVADPTDPDTVYVLNAPFLKSVDGGLTFSSVAVPHGDNHDLWINPEDPRIMVEANDGGAVVTLDGGETWSSIHNQPTAEFYRLTVDDAFPRRLYGAQQDNSTISVPAWTDSGLSHEGHWLEVAGGESGHIGVTPGRPELTYAGNYIGQIERQDREEAGARDVIVYPELADGVAPRDLNYRFQWNAPILVSRWNPEVVYHASHFVHRTTDGGLSWETLSPDLTVGEEEKMPLPGGPVQHDHTGVEVYGSVFALAESPLLPELLWAGTDDGRVHLSRDRGATWEDVSPAAMPPGATVNMIEASPHEAGAATIAVHRYRENDFESYVFRTSDFGAGWTRLGEGGGIPAQHVARVVREDPVDARILYLGTEFGLLASFDGGRRFVPFGDLPATPITDLQVAGDELLVATQGRSFWVLDDLTPVRVLPGGSWDAPALLPAGDAVRLATGGSRGFRGPGSPENRPAGALLHYVLPEDLPEGASLSLRISNAAGETVREFTRKPASGAPEDDGGGDAEAVLETDAGLHRIEWDLKRRPPELLDDTFMSISYTGGAFAPPGEWSASLEWSDGDGVPTPAGATTFTVRPDPRASWSEADLRQQDDLVRRVQALLERIHDRIGALREARRQIGEARERARAAERWDESLGERAESLTDGLTEVEEILIQTESEAGQDTVNFPPRLDNQVAYLYSIVARNYGRPTAGSFQRLDDLEAEAAPVLERLAGLLGPDLTDFNAALAAAGMRGIVLLEP